MEAEEYYKISKRKRGGSDNYGLPGRLYNWLARAELATPEGYKWDEIRTKVLDGSIWEVKGLGPGGIRCICAALAERDKENAPHIKTE